MSRDVLAALVAVLTATAVVVSLCIWGAANFTQSSVTIKKGASLILVDDVAVVHIIQNGSWDSNNVPRPAKEAGVPTVNALQFKGNDTQTVGPFDTAGTYHLFCSVHPGMNLTVIVQ